MQPSRTLPPSQSVRRSLAWSVADGAFYSVMIGVSESYMGALAVELGHGDTALALLVTMPLLAGAAAQLCSGPMMARLGGSPRRLVVTGVALQAACLIGLLWIALTGELRLWPLLLFKVLFWVFGSVVVPAWNAWMTSLTADVPRERYFARRSGLIHFVLLASYLGAGFFLDGWRGSGSGALLRGFATLFAVALVARIASTIALRLQVDVPETPSAGSATTSDRLREAATGSRWGVALYVALVMFGAHVSAPFFTPYMLRTLELDYGAYSVLTAVSILTKSLTFPVWYRVSERFGLRTTLVVAGVGVAMIPALWSAFTGFEVLLAVEAFSGAAWAAFEFASFQLLIQSASPNRRVEFFSISNTATGLAQLAGGLSGSLAIALLGLDYVEVFRVSAVLRMLALVVAFTPLVAWASRVLTPLPRLFLRVASVRPTFGVERRPIVPADDAVAGRYSSDATRESPADPSEHRAGVG